MGTNNSEGFRVLIIDGDAETAGSESLLLSQLGFECRTACDTAAALEEVRTFRPHAVLLDVALSPGGYRLATDLRKQSRLPRVFLVAVTEHADERHQLLSLQAGFDSLLVKPVAPDLLCRLLQGLKDKLAAGN